jgi:hypothetical protein
VCFDDGEIWFAGYDGTSDTIPSPLFRVASERDAWLARRGQDDAALPQERSGWETATYVSAYADGAYGPVRASRELGLIDGDAAYQAFLGGAEDTGWQHGTPAWFWQERDAEAKLHTAVSLIGRVARLIEMGAPPMVVDAHVAEVRKALDALDDRVVAIRVDRAVLASGVEVPFLGEVAHAPEALAAVSQRLFA